MLGRISENEIVEAAYIDSSDLGSGIINVAIDVPRALYYKLISSHAGMEIENDGELLAALCTLSEIKHEYDKIKDALTSVPNMFDSQSLLISPSKPCRRKLIISSEAPAPPIDGVTTASTPVLSMCIAGARALSLTEYFPFCFTSCGSSI